MQAGVNISGQVSPSLGSLHSHNTSRNDPDSSSQISFLGSTISKQELFQILLSKFRNERAEEADEILRLNKISIDSRDQFGNTILMVACQTGSKKLAKLALRYNSNINAQNVCIFCSYCFMQFKGCTALHYCFAYQYIPLGEYLLSKGAKDTIVNNAGLTCYEGLSKNE